MRASANKRRLSAAASTPSQLVKMLSVLPARAWTTALAASALDAMAVGQFRTRSASMSGEPSSGAIALA
jgi:hypothetical protein